MELTDLDSADNYRHKANPSEGCRSKTQQISATLKARKRAHRY